MKWSTHLTQCNLNQKMTTCKFSKISDFKLNPFSRHGFELAVVQQPLARKQPTESFLRHHSVKRRVGRTSIESILAAKSGNINKISIPNQTTIYTMRCSILVLFSAFLSTPVFARHHSRRTAFVPKQTALVSSLTSEPTPLSTLDSSSFAVERDAHIVAAQVSSLVLVATLCRGGSYYQGDDDDYYNDRGYGGGNDDYYSNEGSYNYDDNYYDDRGRSVCKFVQETKPTRKPKCGTLG